jgi:thiosulfate/3-mercaptopyruvate sulfurtransferase
MGVLIDVDELAGRIDAGERAVLLDVRWKLGDPDGRLHHLAGHIPGAVSAPTTENLDADGRFRPSEELRARFGTLGTGGTADVAVYCGSGVTATHQVAALALAGVEAALYPGSWSQWSNDPSRPVATGPLPW